MDFRRQGRVVRSVPWLEIAGLLPGLDAGRTRQTTARYGPGAPARSGSCGVGGSASGPLADKRG